MATTITPATGTMNWEAFEQLPDVDGCHREILEGELQVLPPAKSGHSIIAGNAFVLLLPLQKQGLGRVFLEAGYKLDHDPATWIQPDASFLSTERAQQTDADQHFLGAPELAVEVISPSESASDVERKVGLLLSAGSQAVWVVYPRTRTLHVFLPDGTSVIRTEADAIPAPLGVADWTAKVADLFA